jgi:hypothetical protein
MILLAGGGHTAHIFDGFAPKLGLVAEASEGAGVLASPARDRQTRSEMVCPPHA